MFGARLQKKKSVHANVTKFSVHAVLAIKSHLMQKETRQLA